MGSKNSTKSSGTGGRGSDRSDQQETNRRKNEVNPNIVKAGTKKVKEEIKTSGTDMYHHLDFLSQAEKYRRVFIKSLNDEYAFGGSKTGQRGWKASNEFFRSVKEFQYQNPTFSSFYSKYIIDFLILLFWVSMLVIFLSFSSRKTLDI